MSQHINVKCDGDAGISRVPKVKDTIVFGTSGKCKFIGFDFDGATYPRGFSNRQPTTGGGATISYDYDGSTVIPDKGYAFSYATDGPALGNGTGVIKN